MPSSAMLRLLLLQLLLAMHHLNPVHALVKRPPAESAARSARAKAMGIMTHDMDSDTAAPSAAFVRIPMARRDMYGLKDYTIPTVMPGLQKRATVGSVLTAYATVPTEFKANIYIGTPPQQLSVLFDTGSYRVWVKSKSCTTASCVGSSATYDHTISSSFASMGVSDGVSYLDGTNVSGISVEDTVSVGGTASLPNFQFMEATYLVSFNTQGDRDSDGIVGLSLQPQSSSAKLFFEQLIANGLVDQPQVGYSLSPDGQSGEVVFGGYNTKTFMDPNAALMWAPVTSGYPGGSPYAYNGNWAVPISSFTLTYPSGSVPYTVSTPQSGAIIDTGTSFCIIPQSILSQIATAVGATYSTAFSIYLVSCGAASGGPTLTFALQGVTIDITSSEYVIVPPPRLNLGGPGCIIALQSISDNSGTYVIGNTALKRWASVFDFANKRVGFTLSKAPTPDQNQARQQMAGATTSSTSSSSAQQPPSSNQNAPASSGTGGNANDNNGSHTSITSGASGNGQQSTGPITPTTSSPPDSGMMRAPNINGVSMSPLGNSSVSVPSGNMSRSTSVGSNSTTTSLSPRASNGITLWALALPCFATIVSCL